MGQCFYYALGVMAALLIAVFGIVCYSQNPNVLRESDSLAGPLSQFAALKKTWSGGFRWVEVVAGPVVPFAVW